MSAIDDDGTFHKGTPLRVPMKDGDLWIDNLNPEICGCDESLSLREELKTLKEFLGYVKADMIQSKNKLMVVYPAGWEGRIKRIDELTKEQ